jgi:anthranilate synthase/aminodeoxychorismate synthase-like glutamine amidotransferase
MLLVIDNYDSFTYNLVQYLGELGAEIVVRRNDAVSVEEIGEMAPSGIVLSPGPCAPAQAGVTVDVIRAWGARIPMLGVCLGHQAIGEAFGGRVVRGPVPVHGKVTEVRHANERMFAGCPMPMRTARYHSLVIARDSLPADFTVDAETEDRTIMAVSHKTRPIFGIQFHPESYGTECGDQIIENFLREARA